MSKGTLVAWILALAVTAGVAQYAVYEDGFYGLSQDDSYRTLDAYSWVRDASSGSPVWPPGHRVIVGTALRVNGDLVGTPRFVSAVFGILAVVLVVWLSLELFRSPRTAVVAGALAVVYPPRLVLAAVPLAESLFIATVLLAMCFFARWLSRGSQHWLLLSGAAFGLTTTVRYEGWLFAGGFALVVVLRTLFSWRTLPRPHTRTVVLACAIAAMFPAYWLLSNGFGVLGEAGEAYGMQHGAQLSSLVLRNPLWLFVTENAASMTLIGLVPLVHMVRASAQCRAWVLVAASALLVLSLAAVVSRSLPSHTFWRIPAAWGALLVPFAACWATGSRAWHGERTHKTALLLAALVAVPSLLQCIEKTRTSALHPRVVQLGKRLDAGLSASSDSLRILLENVNVDFVHVVVASQHPMSFVYTNPLEAVWPVSCVALTDSSIAQEFRDRRIRYAVVRTDSMAALLRRQPFVNPVGRYGPWRSFEVEGRPKSENMSREVGR